jgi:hypothetical protein
MEWLFNAEHWLMKPSIPLWLLLLIVLTWPEIPTRLRLLRQAKPEEKRKHYIRVAVEVVGACLLVWLTALAVTFAAQ